MRKLLVLLAAGAFLVAYTVPAPAIAAEWGFYGSARMETFMDSWSKEASATGFDDDDLTWGLGGVSMIGANVEAGEVSAGFQMWEGYEPAAFTQLWGSWNYGAGSLLVGKSMVPVNMFISNQVWWGDIDLFGHGAVYGNTRPMIQLSTGGFKVALVQPSAAGGVVGTAVDTDTTMPKIEASYTFSAGPASLEIMGGMNTYDETTNPTAVTEKDYSIDSYIVALVWKIGLGAIWINGDIFIAQNLEDYGGFQRHNDSASYDATVKDEIIDADSIGYALVVGYKASDTLKFEFGYGAEESELDRPGTYEDEVSAYYANVEITLAEGVTITPEIGQIDFGDITVDGVKTKQGDVSYYGAKWQIAF